MEAAGDFHGLLVKARAGLLGGGGQAIQSSGQASAFPRCITAANLPPILDPASNSMPQGTQLYTAMYLYQRDPAYWPRALEFYPERFLPVRGAREGERGGKGRETEGRGVLRKGRGARKPGSGPGL